MLQREMENWKEAGKKKVERRLDTLVESVNQLEGSPLVEGG